MRRKINLKCDMSTVLTCIGSIGVVVTAITAIKVTPKAINIIEKATEKKGEKLTIIEVALMTGPVYIPSIIIGLSTISCIFGANVLNKQKQAAITSAYALINNSYKSYRNKLIDLHGEDIDVEVRDAIARQHCDYHQINLNGPDRKVIFYEPFSEEHFERYEREIMDAEYHLNRNFVLRGYASLNEFYEFLGLPQTELGELLGWGIGSEYYWLDFEHRLINKYKGIDCYEIVSLFEPDENYID